MNYYSHQEWLDSLHKGDTVLLRIVGQNSTITKEVTVHSISPKRRFQVVWRTGFRQTKLVRLRSDGTALSNNGTRYSIERGHGQTSPDFYGVWTDSKARNHCRQAVYGLEVGGHFIGHICRYDPHTERYLGYWNKEEPRAFESQASAIHAIESRTEAWFTQVFGKPVTGEFDRRQIPNTENDSPSF